MPENYVLLQRTELNETAASVTFANIPQSGYTDLKVVVSARTSRSSVDDGLIMRFNDEANQTNISGREIYGTGSSALSATTNESGYINGNTSTANTFSNIEIYIPNAFGSTAKSYSVGGVQENNAIAALTNLRAMLWNQTASINKLTFLSSTSSNFLANSTFSLYGIAAVGATPLIAPKASGGNIQTDGTYWYHTFLSTGAFVPTTDITCDILQIGSGGGGGSNRGGGGGAGGLRAFTSQSLSVGTYVAAIGAGGTGGGGTSGNASQFHNFTVSPGGGRGGNSQGAGLSGASGGGGGNELQTNATPAGGSATLGNAGGTCDPSNKLTTAGGGGGFGSAGGNGSGNTGGNGGAGVNTYSAWATATSSGVSGFYAGGGGGYGSSGSGSGGSGGGGTGGSGNSNNGSSGIANTGSGGGATSDTGVAYNGGSGIVIIRYTVA